MILEELHIRNFAIIDDLSVPFTRGLNVITGETGAGKSIIIEALSLIRGEKASSDVVRSGEKEASVRAIFSDGKKDLVLERVVQAGGKSRASIDGVMVGLAEMKAVGVPLLEISSQHEHQKLLDESKHLDFVDGFAGLGEVKIKYLEAYQKFSGLKVELDELVRLSMSAEEQKEFFTFQIKEITEAALKNGEDEELERERNLVRHSAALLEKIKGAQELLSSSEGSADLSVGKVDGLLRSAVEIDPSLNELCQISEQVLMTVCELSRGLDAYIDRIDIDPARLEDVEARLFELKKLKKKYGSTIQEILAKGDELSQKLERIENCDSEIARIEKELVMATAELKKSAEKLSAKRAEASSKLAGLVQKELASLGLKKTTFMSGHFKVLLANADETGIDRFSFQISPNEGEPLKPLVRIASGGELSRVMLAIKSVLMAETGAVALEVFDEVDVGIGGAVAEMVGKKLKELSRHRQVISITHLPQVACFGDAHIVVTKMTKNGRTVTDLSTLNDTARVGEIARMLGGAEITQTTHRLAKEMLARSRE